MHRIHPLFARVCILLCAILAVVTGIAAAAHALAPDLLPLFRAGNTAGLVAYLRGTGSAQAALFLFLLQVFQLVSIFLPGLPLHLAAGALFGPLFGGLLCGAGYLSAAGAVFLLARGLHRRFPLKNDKLSRRFASLFAAGGPAAAVVLAYLLPVLSKGLIPYAAAETSLSPSRYLAATALGFGPILLTNCLIGHLLAAGHYTAAGLLFAGIWGLRVLALRRRDALSALVRRYIGS